MEFFNKKEEVIDLQITQFGRHLLSKGKFKPVYYSFFDDNILYDSLKAGFGEDQNESEARIKETPTMHPQVAISSLEKEFNTSYGMIMSNQATAETAVMQKTAEKNYSLPQPIGTSDINSEYYPSWTIKYLEGHISSSSNSLNLQEKNGGNNTVRLPQINTHIETEIKIFSEDETSTENIASPTLSNIVVQNENENFVLLKVMENNSLYQKKNFDIEIFEVIDQVEGSKTIEVLKPLYFFPAFDPDTPLAPIERVTPQDDENYVAYYFDLRIDNEIDFDMLCKYDPTQKKLGVFADERAMACQDVLNQQQKKSINIYEGGIVNDPGEIC